NDGFVNANGLVHLDWLGLGSKPTFPNTSNGTYVLQSDWLIDYVHESIGETGFGTLTQSDGTNSSPDIAVGNGIYLKTGGGLFAGDLRVVAPSVPFFAPPSAIMTHAGGTAMITNDLRLVGQGNRLILRSATFNMSGGSLTAH